MQARHSPLRMPRLPTDVPTIAAPGTVGAAETATCNVHAGGNPIGDALRLVGAVRVLSRWSSGDAVLMQKAAELIDALDPCSAVEQLS